MLKLNILCPACRRRYSVELPDVSGVHTVRCHYCYTPHEVTVSMSSPRSKTAKPSGDNAVAAKVRKCEVALSIAWLVIGAIQCFTLYAAAAGVWNIVNAIVAMRNAKNITAHNPGVVPYFESRKTWLIVLAVVNLILGGVVGIVLVLFEWHLRDFVLRNRGSFEK